MHPRAHGDRGPRGPRSGHADAGPAVLRQAVGGPGRPPDGGTGLHWVGHHARHRVSRAVAIARPTGAALLSICSTQRSQTPTTSWRVLRATNARSAQGVSRSRPRTGPATSSRGPPAWGRIWLRSPCRPRATRTRMLSSPEHWSTPESRCLPSRLRQRRAQVKWQGPRRSSGSFLSGGSGVRGVMVEFVPEVPGAEVQEHASAICGDEADRSSPPGSTSSVVAAATPRRWPGGARRPGPPATGQRVPGVRSPVRPAAVAVTRKWGPGAIPAHAAAAIMAERMQFARFPDIGPRRSASR